MRILGLFFADYHRICFLGRRVYCRHLSFPLPPPPLSLLFPGHLKCALSTLFSSTSCFTMRSFQEKKHVLIPIFSVSSFFHLSLAHPSPPSFLPTSLRGRWCVASPLPSLPAHPPPLANPYTSH